MKRAFFIVFEGLSFGEKIKIADTSFKDSIKKSFFYVLNIHKKEIRDKMVWPILSFQDSG